MRDWIGVSVKQDRMAGCTLTVANGSQADATGRPESRTKASSAVLGFVVVFVNVL